MPSKIFRSLALGIDSIIERSSFLAGILILVTIFATTYEVFTRYVFNEPTDWVMDLGVYLFLWFSFASMAYVQKEGAHIAVDIFIYHLPPRTRQIWDITTGVITLLFSLVLFYYSIGWFTRVVTISEISSGMWRIPIWPVKIVVPLGSLLLAVCILRDVLARIQSLSTRPPQEERDGILANPAIPVSVFLALIALGIFLLWVSGPAGLLILLLTLLLGGVPVFSALGWTGVAGIFMRFGGMEGLLTFPTIAYESLNNFALICLPAYILAGIILERSGVGEDLYDLCSKWTVGFPGGESIATILACSVFAAISSSSAVTAATIGVIALPALAARKYNRKFSYGLLAAGGTLGIMIPPSGTMIIYSAVTEESLGKLFLAGVFPGLVLSFFFILYSSLYCKKTGEYEKLPPFTRFEKFQSLKKALWGLSVPLIILGGIYTGIFTPLESGAVAVVYALFMVVFRGRMKIREIPATLASTLKTSTMIMCIIIGALTMGNFMTLLQLPNQFMDFVIGLGLSRWSVIAIIMGLYVIMGCFLEAVSIMMITLPIIYPLIIKLGFDGIWFAVMVTLNMEMAMITPPVGLNLYVVTSLTKAPIMDIAKGVVPFFFIMVGMMFIVALFPTLSTWLPSAMIRR